MNSFSKVMKSRTLKEAIINIPDSFFEFFGICFSMIFILNPVLYFFRINFHPLIPAFFRTLNPIVAYMGLVLLALYTAKYIFTHEGESLKKLLNRHWAIALFGVFAILMIVSTLINGPSERLIFGYHYRGEGLVGYFSYLSYFLLMAISRNEKHKKIWIVTLLVSSLFPVLHTIIGHYAYGEKMQEFVFHQYNHFGYYLMIICAICSVLIVLNKKLWVKLCSGVLFCLSFLALLSNDTYGCHLAVYVGVIAVCIICSIAKGKFKAVTLIPIGLVAMTLAFGCLTSDFIHERFKTNNLQFVNDTDALLNGKEDAENSTGVARIILWENGFRYLAESPFIGQGADATAERLKEATNDNDRCHCEYLNYAMCYGVPAAFFYIAAIVAIYLRGLKYKSRLTEIQLTGLCAALFYLASAVIGNSMYYTAPYLFILLGMGYYKSPSPEAE
ncbi:MAG: O-antigen ligase family protein [Oscillospiraceae bacterium]|nr:O-antigen ligase family protein [Oscillospiraceae bacterium]